MQCNPFKLVDRLTGGRDVPCAGCLARGKRSVPEIAGFDFHNVPLSSVHLPLILPGPNRVCHGD